MNSEKNDAKWYEIVRAQPAIYTDPETGKIITRNLIMLEGGVYRTFEYPKDGIKRMLLKVGDKVKIEGTPQDGPIVLVR